MSNVEIWFTVRYALKEARLQNPVLEITRKTLPASFDKRIGRLNLLMRGWLNYFKPASMYGKLRTMDRWVRNRLRYCDYYLEISTCRQTGVDGV